MIFRRRQLRTDVAPTGPLTSYQMVIWDFDGTLADTLWSALDLYNQMARKHGFEPVADPDAVRHLTARGFIKQHRVPVLKLPALIREYLSLQKEHMPRVQLFPGLAAVLRAVKARGLRQGIISSNSPDNIALCLQANSVEALFDFVIGYPRLFGKARAINRLLKKERIAPEQVLYVGDEIRDIEAARQARIATAAVTWGFNTEEALGAYSPAYILKEPAELLTCLPSAG